LSDVNETAQVWVKLTMPSDSRSSGSVSTALVMLPVSEPVDRWLQDMIRNRRLYQIPYLIECVTAIERERIERQHRAKANLFQIATYASRKTNATIACIVNTPATAPWQLGLKLRRRLLAQAS
jgi:hypothetical protein